MIGVSVGPGGVVPTAGTPFRCCGRPGRARPWRAGGVMAAVPGRLPLIEPVLATPTRTVPAYEDAWAAEAKWDGAIH
jgi:hypothetical protein